MSMSSWAAATLSSPPDIYYIQLVHFRRRAIGFSCAAAALALLEFGPLDVALPRDRPARSLFEGMGLEPLSSTSKITLRLRLRLCGWLAMARTFLLTPCATVNGAWSCSEMCTGALYPGPTGLSSMAAGGTSLLVRVAAAVASLLKAFLGASSMAR